jgi:glycosyltransferase involved in cell wall biosynthesis
LICSAKRTPMYTRQNICEKVALYRLHTANVLRRLLDRIRLSTRHRTTTAMRPELCGLAASKVSVVLPVYNQDKCLAESIESVLGQSYERCELIIVDDGSTDQTPDIIRRYAGDPRVLTITQDNQGLAAALSNGFKKASGEFWTWTSADNLMEAPMLGVLVDYLSRTPSVGMVYADYLAINDAGSVLSDIRWRRHNRPNPKDGVVCLPRCTRTLAKRPDNFIGPCFLYRGWIGKVVGDYRPPAGVEDFDYWMRIGMFFKIMHLGQSLPLYKYRVHPNTLSSRCGSKLIHERTLALLRLQKTRLALTKRKLSAYCDAEGRAAVRSLSGCSQLFLARDFVAQPFDPAGPIADTASFFCLSLETVLNNLSLLLSHSSPVVIPVSEESDQVHRLQELPIELKVLLLAKNLTAAQSIKNYSTHLFVDGSSAQAISAIRCFVYEKIFGAIAGYANRQQPLSSAQEARALECVQP